MKRTAIIILNWNGFNDTVECLESLRKMDFKGYAVILVDNGSGGKEGSKLKEMFPEIHLIQNKENRGFAGGNNDGINWALDNGFEYVVNLNNDCVVDKDWLPNLVNGLEASGCDFGSSRIMFYGDRDIIESDGGAIKLDGSVVYLNRGRRWGASAGAISRYIFYACGAASIYSIKCLSETKIKENQYFDELFFAYYEDSDLGTRLNMKGYKGISIPAAIVYHKLWRTSEKGSDFQRFNVEKNRLLCKVLNYPFYLIVAGELVYFAMLLKGRISRLFYPGRQESGKDLPQLRSPGGAKTFFRARAWMISRAKEVLADRQERKKRGFINKRIFNLLSWDFPEACQRKV